MIQLGRPERTPLWRRLLGFPAHRRWKTVITPGGLFGQWEYLP